VFNCRKDGKNLTLREEFSDFQWIDIKFFEDFCSSDLNFRVNDVNLGNLEQKLMDVEFELEFKCH